MKRQSMISVLLLITFSLTNILCAIPTVSAQSITILGEIKTIGSVFIESSNGRWTPSGATYPLLQDTAIKTAEGVASIYFRDGSRVDLSKETMAVINGSHADYSINLGKGIIAFNISPSASLTVVTASTNISINSKKGIVQKVAYEKPGRVLGVISTNDNGTEIRSISGRIFVNISASETKLIASGESIFIGSDGKYKVYKAQAITVKGESYLIKNGDLLEIKTEGLEGTFRVNSQGDIVLPPDISLHVQGLTTSEVEQLIAKELRKSVLKTIVTVLEKKKIAGLLLPSSSGEKLAAAAIAATFYAGGTFVYYKGFASPSGF